MEKHIYDEKNGLGYTLYGDYYLPDLELPEDEEAHYGKYGMLRKTYLKEHRKAYYQMLIRQGKLNKHLNKVDREAHERMDILVAQMAENRELQNCLSRTADAVGKKDEWNKDCSRGNGAYRDCIWVRSKTGV